jgi:hypothetical protein
MKQQDNHRPDSATDPRLLLLSPHDNILVLRSAIKNGEQILIDGHSVLINSHIGLGHKLAATPIPSGTKVIKYGAPIGTASRDIAIGDHVHLDNLVSDYTKTHTIEDQSQALEQADKETGC